MQANEAWFVHQKVDRDRHEYEMSLSDALDLSGSLAQSHGIPFASTTAIVASELEELWKSDRLHPFRPLSW